MKSFTREGADDLNDLWFVEWAVEAENGIPLSDDEYVYEPSVSTLQDTSQVTYLPFDTSSYEVMVEVDGERAPAFVDVDEALLDIGTEISFMDLTASTFSDDAESEVLTNLLRIAAGDERADNPSWLVPLSGLVISSVGFADSLYHLANRAKRRAMPTFSSEV